MKESGIECKVVEGSEQNFKNGKKHGKWTLYYENGKAKYNFEKLKDICKTVTRNLDNVVEINEYPIIQSKTNNLDYRPLGIGVQGLADVFCQLRYAFDDPEAQELNRHIFETMYYASLKASSDLAKKWGPYGSYNHSPLSHGQFHFDLCSDFEEHKYLSGRWDWDALRSQIQEYGVRNSLLLAPMPTASTSQILGNNECFEPFTSNLYLRRTSVGEFYIMNHYLVTDLQRLGIWNEKMRQYLLSTKGSIQTYKSFPTSFRRLYRTVWEIPQKSLITMAHERQFFIDQSQSLNLFMETPTLEKLTKMHFYTWKKGLKTGCYYLRSRAAVSSVSVTLSPTSTSKEGQQDENNCISCSA